MDAVRRDCELARLMSSPDTKKVMWKIKRCCPQIQLGRWRSLSTLYSPLGYVSIDVCARVQRSRAPYQDPKCLMLMVYCDGDCVEVPALSYIYWTRELCLCLDDACHLWDVGSWKVSLDTIASSFEVFGFRGNFNEVDHSKKDQSSNRSRCLKNNLYNS
jgi:hypothetical protein